MSQLLVMGKINPQAQFYDEVWFKLLKEILEVSSFVATIIGIIAVILTVVNHFQSRDKDSRDLVFKKNENTLRVLETVSHDLVPSIDKFQHEFLKAEQELMTGLDESQKLDNEKLLSMFLNLKLKTGIVNIFNKLEYICTFVTLDLVNVDELYRPINSIVIGFVKQHKEVYEKLKKGAPYESLTTVVETWEKQRRREYLESKKREIDKELEKN